MCEISQCDCNKCQTKKSVPCDVSPFFPSLNCQVTLVCCEKKVAAITFKTNGTPTLFLTEIKEPVISCVLKGLNHQNDDVSEQESVKTKSFFQLILENIPS